MDITELLLTADAPAIAVFAIYLWRETKRYQKLNASLREDLEQLHAEHVEYVQKQAKRWRELATTVHSIRRNYENKKGNSNDV